MHHLILGLGWFIQVNRSWLYNDIRVSEIRVSAKLTQLDEHQTEMALSPSSIITEELHKKRADLAFLYYFVVKSKKNNRPKVYLKWRLNLQPEWCNWIWIN